MAIIGLQAVKAYPNQGMPNTDIDAFMQVARSRDEVIIVRPVEEVCRTLLEERYATKGFHVKGKSSNWGPQAGFVCVDQRLSKLATKPQAEIDRYAAQVQDCLHGEKPAAVKQQLTLSAARMRYLEQARLIEHVHDDALSKTGGTKRFEASPRDSGKVWTFQAVPEDEARTRYRIFVLGPDARPVALEVLASTTGRGPLTADYDLLAVCPRLSHLSMGTWDRMPNPMVSQAVVMQSLGKGLTPADPRALESFEKSRAQLLSEEAKERFKKREDKEMGNITPRIRACVDALNRHMGRIDNPAVHHNADSGSPATDPSSNFPCSCFHPRMIGLYQDAAVIEKQEVRAYFQTLLDEGYFVPRNPLWGDLTNLRSRSFTQARASLEAALNAKR